MKMYKYKNIMLEKLQKQTRKINALIRQNQIRRIKVIMLVCLCVFNSVSSVFAIQNENITYGDYTILCFLGTIIPWSLSSCGAAACTH